MITRTVGNENKLRAGTSSDNAARLVLRNPLWADVLIYLVLFLLGLFTALPIYMVLVRSLSPSHIINQYPLLLWPREWTFEAYVYILKTQTLQTSFNNTVFITVVGTFLNLLFTVPAAYALSKRNLPGQNLLMKFIIFAMLFNAGVVPTFMVVKSVGLYDSLWSLIIPSLVNPFNLILLRNYFWSVPRELEEAALIDGASDWEVLYQIVLPISLPALATIGLFYAVGHWNELFSALFYIGDSTKWPLQLLLRSIIIENNFQNMGTMGGFGTIMRVISPENVKAATVLYAIFPIFLVYPLIQGYFVQGIRLGAIKE